MKTLIIKMSLVLLMLLTSQSFSATINVPDPNHLTIQAGIDAAVNGDIVSIASGTYNEAINFNGKSITVRSATGNPADVTIDGSGNFHVVQCISGENPNAVLEGVTITGGNANGIAGNRLGGGMYNSGSSPTVTNCIFSGNQANVGGGMFNSVSFPIITHCVFSGNQADFGGGIVNNGGSPTVMHCVFNGNTATNVGGGMYNFGGSPTVTNCVFNGNRANDGGGIYSDTAIGITINNATFVNNISGGSGGGLLATGVTTYTVNSSIFWHNSDSGGMDTSAQIHVGSGTVDVNYSNVMGGWLGLGTGNINADPLFIDADGPDDNPATFADNNVRLSVSSPCIDAGDNSAVPVGVVTDLDGSPRQLDDPFTIDTGVGFPTVDMGAYEFNFSEFCQFMNKGDLNCDSDINLLDFVVMSANWLISQ